MKQITDNNLIVMHRGDTLEFPFIINVSNALSPRKYKLRAGDKVYFGVMEPNKPFEEAIIRKVFTNADLDANDYVVITLGVNDTINLLPGNYFYEIKLENTNGVQTLLGKRLFTILD